MITPEISSAQKKKKKDEDRVETIFSAYPQGFFVGSMRLGFEKLAGEKTGLHGIIGIGAGEYSTFLQVTDFTEIMAEFQPRFYVLRNTVTLDGPFVSPYVSFRYITFKDDVPIEPFGDRKASAFEIGYLLGYQKVFYSHFVIGMYAGGGMGFPSGNSDLVDKIVNGYRKGVSPHVGLQLGIAF
ncbi:MAG: hypothetical protein M3Q97_11345 [Bacteroidota bacterium]|nr:hypothetical protein [Bacteroidota bacterium]